jgi:hypothetical protein
MEFLAKLPPNTPQVTTTGVMIGFGVLAVLFIAGLFVARSRRGR